MEKTNHGGLRPGAGRPKGTAKTEGWTTVSIVFRPSKLKKIDRLAKSKKMTRSQLINALILDEIEGA